MNQNVLDAMVHWIKERDVVRMNKEAGKPKPWTDDPILQQFRFCNVRREDDHVTKWFKRHWRHPNFWGHRNFIPAIMLGRTINWPATLEEVGFPLKWDPERIKVILDARMKRGDKVYTGAYMITAGPTGVSKNDWVLGNAESYFKNPPKIDPTSIRKSWEVIMANKYPCVGPFIAAQVIADLKQTDHLNKAADWWDWAAVGPGSMRGLNRLHERPLGFHIPQDHGLAEMRHVKAYLGLEWLCLQDVQNCLCELDKYMRVKLGQGKPRSGYNGRK